MAAILVIGGSSGIGYALASKLAGQGDDVFATYAPLTPVGSPGNCAFFDCCSADGVYFHTLVASSKGAVEGLMRALAAELAPKIRVNCVAPSLTDTPLIQNLINTAEKRALNEQRHPLKRIGKTADIADAVEFLLSDKSSWITGQILHVDGGMSKLKV